MAQISKTFVEKGNLQKGNLNGALKLLTDNMDHGILPSNDESISKIKMKHPQALAPDPIILLPDEAQNIHPIRYKDITAKEVHKTVINTKGGSGPLGLDADGWHRISASNCFGDTSADFRRVIVSFAKKLCSEKLDASPSSLSSKVLRLTSGCNKYI